MRRDILVLFVCVAAIGLFASMGSADKAEHLADVEEWYKGRIERLTSETGYLSLIGLFPIEEGENSFGSAEDNDFVFPDKAPEYAGKIIRDGLIVEIEAAEGVDIMLDGEHVDRVTMPDEKAEDFSRFEMDSFYFYLIERGGQLYFRVGDRKSIDIELFKGTERWPVDEAWRIPAVFERFDPPLPITVPDVLGFNRTFQCEGEFVFQYEGETYRLKTIYPWKDEYFVAFADETTADETYGGGRFIYVHRGDENGNTFIDFNRAYNPPCAFTVHTSCPLPPEGNELPFPVRVGEKKYVDDHH